MGIIQSQPGRIVETRIIELTTDQIQHKLDKLKYDLSIRQDNSEYLQLQIDDLKIIKNHDKLMFWVEGQYNTYKTLKLLLTVNQKRIKQIENSIELLTKTTNRNNNNNSNNSGSNSNINANATDVVVDSKDVKLVIPTASTTALAADKDDVNNKSIIATIPDDKQSESISA